MLQGLIVKAISGYYYVLPQGNDLQTGPTIQCRGKGILRKQENTPLVGDQVRFAYTENGEGTVTEILSRSNQLLRPPIANVDLAIIVFSVKEPTLNLQLLDKFLVYVEQADVPCLICLTKSDLMQTIPLFSEKKGTISDVDVDKVKSLYEHLGYEVTLTSAKEDINLDWIRERVTNLITVIFGQSGVGKSSLLNHMIRGLNLQTNTISQKLGRGKHTTRHVELLPLDAGGYIADTPGFSQLDLIEIEVEQLEGSFREFAIYRESCRFRGCLHVNEPGCAVKEAVSQLQIAESRYQHYLVFFQEIKDRKKRY